LWRIIVNLEGSVDACYYKEILLYCRRKNGNTKPRKNIVFAATRRGYKEKHMEGASTRAIAALVTAILGTVLTVLSCCCGLFVILGVPLNLVGLVLAIMEKKAISDGDAPASGNGICMAAIIVAGVGLLLNLAWIVLLLLNVVFGIAPGLLQKLNPDNFNF